MPATMKFPLELMTGDRGLSAEDSIGNLLSAGVRLSEVFVSLRWIAKLR